MELVLKLPKGKPPFIGILFETEHQGNAINKDFILEHRNKMYKIILEPIGRHLNLRLICEELVEIRFYAHIRYDYEKLKNWLYLTSNETKFNFSHLILVKDKHQVIGTSPGLHNYTLKLESCKLITEAIQRT